jgi:hypothetical protein
MKFYKIIIWNHKLKILDTVFSHKKLIWFFEKYSKHIFKYIFPIVISSIGFDVSLRISHTLKKIFLESAFLKKIEITR